MRIIRQLRPGFPAVRPDRAARLYKSDAFLSRMGFGKASLLSDYLHSSTVTSLTLVPVGPV